MKKFIVLTFFVIGVVIIAVIGVIKWSLWQPMDMKKDSFAYTYKVPEVVKSFPTWAQLSPPLYDVMSIAEGLKPSVVRMRYTSSLHRDQFVAEATKLQFKCPDSTEKSLLCEKQLSPGQSLQLIYSLRSDDSAATIELAYIEQG